MSSSETDSEDEQYDVCGDNDDISGLYEQYNDINGEDDYDFESTQRFLSLYREILGEVSSDLSQADATSIPADYTIYLAMHSPSTRSAHRTTPQLLVDDSLEKYLRAPPLFRKAASAERHCLALDPTIDENGQKSLSTPELFVGNLPPGTRYSELKSRFEEDGYRVSRVTMKASKSGAAYAFVRFDSIATAVDVFCASGRKRFVFKGNELNIDRSNKDKKQLDVKSLFKTIQIDKPTIATPVRFPITDIYYGTLVTNAAMRNIYRANSVISNADGFGIVAHRFLNCEYPTTFSFSLDVEKKKLAIIATYLQTPFGHTFDETTELKFEWNFHDLKCRKISPVFLDDSDVYLLIELKRPPIIVETHDISGPFGDDSKETRQPGTGLIGHANAWLFRLTSADAQANYVRLFAQLHRYNLTPRQFTEKSILYCINSRQAVRKNLESVQLISNDDWVQANQDRVDDFFRRRWASYPFETKFEIMKLISKHVITVYDLIVDEQAENILKMCTINTLIALTDKIVEFAPRWFAMTCDNDEEDWSNENPQLLADSLVDEPITTTEHFPPATTAHLAHIRDSTTGASVSVAQAAIPLSQLNTKKPSLVAPKVAVGTFSRLLMYAFKQLLDNYELCRVPETGVFVTKLELRTANMHASLIRKIYITPSTVLYEGPYREEKCAVTREFEKHQDRFLRLTFRDEDYRMLHDYNDNMSTMYERIKKILTDGVKICDRHYEFLAFSSSQLREHSCWMFASLDKDVSADGIRSWMGDFTNVHPVAKLAARLGQLFSTSVRGIKLERKQFKQIRDEESLEMIDDDHYRCGNYTDGIGIIASKFAQQLAEEMHLSNKSFYPSAFQIRCGGYKGMVCVDTRSGPVEPGIDLYFRPSMKKFDTENFSIDVVRTSLSPSVAYLNRQIILLLSSLGIANENFISLQNHMVEHIKALTGNPQEACEALKELNEFGGNGYHAFLIAYLERLGERKDPFVQQLLLVFKTFLVKELRTKAKIRVPDSWCLLGVIDETCTLRYGQVFIQVDNSHQKQHGAVKEIFKGPVIVTRNPCFHPGDIRKLEAVDVPALHGLRNVIVFPMDGPRPHAMEMSGGDLDGDNFWISRHPDLIFQKYEQPFEYQEQEDEANRDQLIGKTSYTIKDVCNFFGEYIAADNLGVIANSHLVFADMSPLGAKDERCLKLARMHSVAVDFAKKGVSAPRLTKELRPQEYPHYMEKKDKKSYHSTTVLGILYDQIEHYKTDLDINREEEIKTAMSFPYKFFLIDGDTVRSYIKEARTLKHGYDRELKRVMRQYGIEHEVEIVSGYILKFTSKQYAKETKLFELRNEIAHAYRVIQDKHLRIFWQQFYQTADACQDERATWSEISKKLTWKNQIALFEFYAQQDVHEEIKRKASAWFRVTYDPWRAYVNTIRKKRSQDKDLRYRGLFSFAWLLYPILLAIFDEKKADPANNIEPKKRRKKKNR